jgi:hypothetical protein
MPTSPAGSLFAADYSVSAPASPVSLSPQATPSPRPSPRPTPNSRPGSSPLLSPIPTYLRPKPLDVTFDSTDPTTTSNLLPTPPASSDDGLSPIVSPLPSPLTPPPSGDRKNGSLVSPTAVVAGKAMEREWEMQKREEARRDSKMSLESKAKSGKSGKSRRGSEGYNDFDGCMQGEYTPFCPLNSPPSITPTLVIEMEVYMLTLARCVGARNQIPIL